MPDMDSEQVLTYIKNELIQGIKFIGLPLSPLQQASLVQYLVLLEKWNKTYNLTAIRDIRQMLVQHVLDSLVVIPHLPFNGEGVQLLDVGSGAGLPGVPIAVASPEVSVTMLDSNQKKAAFMQHAIGELRLTNANVVCARVEEWKYQEPFQIITSRAYSELRLFVEQTKHLLKQDGIFAAMKGQFPKCEIEALPSEYICNVIKLNVPGMDAERHLVLVSKQ